MSKYLGASCKLCRREGQKLFLKGDKCYTDKCPVARRPYAPGEHGQGRRKMSYYGTQLREKQKAKRVYGIMEKQFRRYFVEAAGMKGTTGDNLFQLLERRLDNVIYRMGFASSRSQAREMVSHGFFMVNGKKMEAPAYNIKLNDVVTMSDRHRNNEIVKGNLDIQRTIPAWLSIDKDKMEGIVIGMPKKEDMDIQFEDHLIVELFSK